MKLKLIILDGLGWFKENQRHVRYNWINGDDPAYCKDYSFIMLKTRRI